MNSIKQQLPIEKSSQKMHRRVSKKGKIFYAGMDKPEEPDNKQLIKYKVIVPEPKYKKGDSVSYKGKKGIIDMIRRSLLGETEYAINFEDGTRRRVFERNL